MWFDNEIKRLSGSQVFNDSKTPSGQVHIGSLRGVVLHDALHRACREHGMESTFIYGLDDMDPLDGLPANASDSLRANLGKPLCKIAAPPGSGDANLAEHYAKDFLATFAVLGADATIYRTSHHYLSGTFNPAIEQILARAHIVREVYRNISKSARPDDWYPYQVICENCGLIGSTRVHAFDGREVTYTCQPGYTSWANGCGYKGRVSPYDGHGKLVWKLEWAAKWAQLGVTFEASGKDHCTKGGSRDVSNLCYRRIFNRQPPVGLAYEFFLVEGSKMSSSKGVGASAASMVKLLPPGLLRFLMIRGLPKRTVNFSTDQAFFIKLFNDYDAVCAASDDASRAMQHQVGVNGPPVHQPVGFGLLLALLQLPHLDVRGEINRRYQLNPAQQQDLEARIATAQAWLDNFAGPDDRITIHQQPPASLDSLPGPQARLLQLLAEQLTARPISDEEQMQQLLFDCARLTPLPPREAFVAVYRAFLNNHNGPKAGSLLAWLDHEFVLERLRQVRVDVAGLWRATGLDIGTLAKELKTVQLRQLKLKLVKSDGLAVVEATALLDNGQTIVRRTRPVDAEQCRTWLEQLKANFAGRLAATG